MNMKTQKMLGSLFVAITIGSCMSSGRVKHNNQSNSKTENLSQKPNAIDKETAITIAKEDAQKAYGTLEMYNMHVCELNQTWRVIFELKDSSRDGGGPEYVIDKRTGIILHKTYYQ
jgi:hypothetical protein